jgi:rare lipoprotein A (peptidoglycan hydrolase)
LIAKHYFVKRPLAMIFLSLLVALRVVLTAFSAKASTASWCGDELRGRRMANGRPFNPDKLAAASWFYPPGSRVTVTARSVIKVAIKQAKQATFRHTIIRKA